MCVKRRFIPKFFDADTFVANVIFVNQPYIDSCVYECQTGK